MGYSPPGSSVHGILQAWVLEWVAISFSRESSQPRDWSWVSHTTGRFFTIWATREADPDRRRQTISYIRWHRSRWAEAWRTVLKNWDSTGKNSQVLGKHVKSPVTRKSHRTGGQGRFQYSSFWLPKELFLGSCGHILPAHQWTSFVAKWHGTTNLSFSPHLKKKNGVWQKWEKVSYIANRDFYAHKMVYSCNTVSWALQSSPFCQWENWGTMKRTDSPNVT